MEKLNNEVIRHMYLDLDMSGDKIASALECSKSSVCRRIKKMGITKSAIGHNGRNGKRGTVYSNGYPVVYMPEHHRAKSNGYVREHIIVMEKMLGRHLNDTEVVHHINGNKCDNRPENLMLFPDNRAHMIYHWNERHSSNL